jgi:hypothetical protein
MTDVVVPLALYGYGDVRSLLALPFRVLQELVTSTKQDSIKTLIERKLNGRSDPSG